MKTTSTATLNPIAEKMNGKPVLYREAKTVLSFNSPFQEKLLSGGANHIDTRYFRDFLWF